jgi:amino acid transporter
VADATHAGDLARGAVGLREVLFQSICSMAPAGAVALSIAAGAVYSGGALPLAVALALVGCLLVASSIGQLAKHLPSAGGVYTYPAEAIHSTIGFLTGWGYALVETLIGSLTMIGLGWLFGAVFHSEWNWNFTATWIAFTCIGAVTVALFNYRGVKLSARMGTILGMFEILVFVLLAIFLIVKAGSHNTLQVFTLHFATIKGYKGFSGVAAGSVFAVLAFSGFEASVPLAEEARNPRRTIGRAVLLSCLGIGIFYVFTTYAGEVFFGPARYSTIGALGGVTGSPWIALARDAWGIGWVVAFIAIQNSSFANGNAGTLAVTRTWFAMARIRLLPAPLAATHPKYKSPYVGVIVQLVLTLVISLPLGIHYGPATAFVFVATILTAVIILVYMVFNLSCLLYYLRRKRSEFNILLHGVIPVLGIIAFIPAWLAAMGIGSSFLKFVSPLAYPASLTGDIILAWFVLGVLLLVYFYMRHPERLPLMRRVFGDEPVAGEEPIAGEEPRVTT